MLMLHMVMDHLTPSVTKQSIGSANQPSADKCAAHVRLYIQNILHRLERCRVVSIHRDEKHRIANQRAIMSGGHNDQRIIVFS